ncbi:Threonylcarbamoyladenosine tRNA methylthiotransferase MtaB [Bosea sp. 62]|uniref:tRNA (N(6)-L-threonylcarbamoyladenosine(37)-C(2))- methylthiotransferase MtaB n=1 Tax=unclassified Bosea (in: a-proteobacteria) TaxID=2653178 RepID=UPI0012586633|nr:MULTISPECIES: tRNA (N(6)-L-threonylcarbamoyladenosine(37)-C(2))-methylthiotransferase MtaB [unclassified Bosea (in: a-proteobacteria)]CAD5292334.1 Threonylcarbamoyladenosine tRNA methylthiotransferase MtaB [Bosea sp. 7B]CAD5299184.1 Threonylcarbamoyladenosine tRNA methylthiotransferase MtaB [Bosea sp. 21B]CAD5299315.1 Threonylcarbamoyladenosine tRNA methylthiotransferase MtaB [Bosea sp. 46]VVT61623.1 Threonylcarbamoyladenosine tRNA methylthiotransferase MtaB [Bosea sp. EC-HK365B]VXB07851.1 
MGVELVTFGCRLNLVESETVERQARTAGLSDLAVINSCAVTAEAVRQAGQAIRRLAREKPERPIVVTGCAAQIEPARFAAMPEVARVLGNAEKLDAASWRALASSNSLRAGAPADVPSKIMVGDIMQARDASPQRTQALGQHTRGFLQVQNGCDHRCTFCVIPLGRGNARSSSVEEVVAQARRLVEEGASEIVLTGVDLTSYGREQSDGPTLGALVGAILAALPELKRLRLSSLDAVEVDDDLRDLIAEESRLMPHLHLSLQSGDDLVLKRMKRRHSRAEAVSFCKELRALRPDIVFGADLIAGFPTEDEAMFSRTLALIEECGLSYVHGFPFSPRPGTPAARMPQVAGGEIKERAARLREAAEAAYGRHLSARIGRPLSVLTERGDTGRAEDFTLVRFGHGVAPGQILAVTAHAQNGKSLLAA